MCVWSTEDREDGERHKHRETEAQKQKYRAQEKPSKKYTDLLKYMKYWSTMSS